LLGGALGEVVRSDTSTWIERRGPAAVAAVLVGVLAGDDGGYPATSWGWSAVAACGLVAGAGLAGTLRHPQRLQLALLAAACGLGAWVWLSAAWSADPSASIGEGERMLLYVVGVSALVLSVRRVAVPALLGGVLAAITAACGYGVAARLFPGVFGESSIRTADPEAALRLAEPLGYSNALGLFAGLGILLALGFAARNGRTAGAAAAACLPVLSTALYFSFGRGAWLALGAGAGAALIADPRRLKLATAGLVLVAPSASAVVLARWVDDGRGLGLAIVALSLLAAAAASGLEPLWRRLDRSGVRRRYSVFLLAGLGGALVAGLAVAGGPVALAEKGYDSFNAPPPALRGEPSRRLLSLSGHGREEYWDVALDAAADHPLLGSGAGSFQRYWLKHREQPLPVRDAHSLYLETLAELGPPGLALLAALLAIPLLALPRARRHPLGSAALGAYVAYLLHAGIDWDWELPAVTLAALACGAALVLLVGADSPAPAGLRAASAAAALLVAVAAGLGFAGNRALAAAEDALDHSNFLRAASEARSARAWTPWSAESWRLLGEAQFAQGEVEPARRSLLRGLERDTGDWELWLDLALASEGHAQRQALAEALQLNPLSPEIAELRAGD
jgi:O-antigen ligase/polysaccharide polymerase Wzy-like membrane protein